MQKKHNFQKIIFLLSCLIFNFSLNAQESITYVGNSENLGNSFYLIERSDIRRYDNDKYTGLITREVQSCINTIQAPRNAPSFTQNDVWYSGSFFVLEETKSNTAKVAKCINAELESEFRINLQGGMTVVKDNGYPSYRSFPSFPEKKVNPGDSWISEGKRAVDPLNSGKITCLPMLIQYTFIGKEVYKGDEVFRLKAKWATRYGNQYIDYQGDKNLLKASGTHDADIIVLQKTGEAIFIRDTYDEYFIYQDTHKVAFKGTTLLFTEYPISTIENSSTVVAKAKQSNVENIDKVKNINMSVNEQSLQNELSQKNISVEKTEKGIMLSIQDIKFLPDSSEIVPEEKHRIQQIAQQLLQLKDRRFFVEGHTASTGNPKGESELSIERAKAVVDLMVNFGLQADKFVYSGAGGTKPISDNFSEAGKAKNRRVEITILGMQ